MNVFYWTFKFLVQWFFIKIKNPSISTYNVIFILVLTIFQLVVPHIFVLYWNFQWVSNDKLFLIILFLKKSILIILFWNFQSVSLNRFSLFIVNVKELIPINSSLLVYNQGSINKLV